MKFFGQIGHWEKFQGRNFDSWFSELDAKYRHIIIKMHCYGGEVFEGNMIMNTIAAARATVWIDVVGVAASMGGLVLQKAAKRRITRNGFVMVHSPQGGGRGTASHFKNLAKHLEDMEANFIEEFMAKSTKNKKDIEDLFDGGDHWFSAKDALEWGLVDEIIDPVADIKQLDKQQAAQLGQEAVFNRFVAELKKNEDKPIINNNMDNAIKAQFIANAQITGVTAESSDTAIFQAVEAKIKEEKDARIKAETELAEFKTAEIKAEIDEAIENQLTTESERDFYTELGNKMGIKALKTSLTKLKPHEPITANIKGKKKTNGKLKGERDGWTWDDYQEKDPKALEKLEKEDKETFDALHKAKYC